MAKLNFAAERKASTSMYGPQDTLSWKHKLQQLKWVPVNMRCLHTLLRPDRSQTDVLC